LDVDPDLGAALSETQRAQAKRELVVEIVGLGRGAWREDLSAPELFGLLVVDGALVRRVVAGPGRSLEVLTRGDFVRPSREEEGETFGDAWFSSLGDSRVAVLGSEFAEAAARWPALLDALLERAIRRVCYLAHQAALDSRVGMERRVLLALWHLADRCGLVTPAGIELPLPLTHQMISELVGAQRPSVSEAIGRLTSAGTLARTEEQGWLLDRDSERALMAEAEPAGGGKG
jgi:hypothetical protein